MGDKLLREFSAGRDLISLNKRLGAENDVESLDMAAMKLRVSHLNAIFTALKKKKVAKPKMVNLFKRKLSMLNIGE